MWKQINTESKKLLKLCNKNSFTISTAESCTGGMIASSIVHNPGSSDVFEQGYITYSNRSKQNELKISLKTLNKHGAVSKQVAEEMLKGLLYKTKSSIGICVTGIAGPGGSSQEKPVGLIWISFGNKTGVNSKKFLFTGSRLEIRLKTTINSLKLINKFII